MWHLSNFITAGPPRYDLWVFAFRWNIPVIKYFIGPDPNGHLWGANPDYKAIVRSAVESWVPYQGSFTMQEVATEAEANLILRTKSKTDGKAIANVRSIRWLPVRLNASDQITIDFESSAEVYDEFYWYEFEKGLETVVRHEVGHGLGLSHNPSANSTTNPGGAPSNVGILAVW